MDEADAAGSIPLLEWLQAAGSWVIGACHQKAAGWPTATLEELKRPSELKKLDYFCL